MARDEEAHELSMNSLKLVIEAEYLLGELEAHTRMLQKYVSEDHKAREREHDDDRS